jgi:hypothetical protein
LFVVEVSSSTLPFQSMPAAQAIAGTSHAGDRMILRCRLLLDHSIPQQTTGPVHFPRTMPIRGPGQPAAALQLRFEQTFALDKLELMS